MLVSVNAANSSQTDVSGIDVFGIGNAIVDTIAFVDQDFIREHDLQHGSMMLTDAQTQGRILTAMKGMKLELHSGGSAANTMFGLAISGGSGVYSGKTGQDENGSFYREDLHKFGIEFDVTQAEAGAGPTATCIVLITPDAQRTMLTNLGASILLSETDIDTDRLAKSSYMYMEGYLWDAEKPRAACQFACAEAKKNDVAIAFTFSDPFCVERYKSDFFHLVKEYCDVVFCNAEEARHFSGMDDINEAATYIADVCKLAFITNGEKGAIVAHNNKLSEVPGYPVTPVDTTGAGDAFAAGVLYGLSHSHSSEASARWGNYLASETVTTAGARLEENRKSKALEILKQ